MTEIPYGNPDGMRAFALTVRSVADQLGNVATTAYNGAFSFEWEGLAALRFRGNIE